MGRRNRRGVRLAFAGLVSGLLFFALAMTIAVGTYAWSPDDTRVEFRSRLDTVPEPDDLSENTETARISDDAGKVGREQRASLALALALSGLGIGAGVSLAYLLGQEHLLRERGALYLLTMWRRSLFFLNWFLNPLVREFWQRRWHIAVGLVKFVGKHTYGGC